MTVLHAEALAEALTEALAEFAVLFDEALAAGEPDPTAMVVATAGLDARPSARTVLLKSHDARGFVFYTHLDGRKGRELQANPHAALLFHWPRVRPDKIEFWYGAEFRLHERQLYECDCTGKWSKRMLYP